MPSGRGLVSLWGSVTHTPSAAVGLPQTRPLTSATSLVSCRAARSESNRKLRGRNRKRMAGGRGCFGMKMDRIGSISGLGC
jgi:hypothetical protein